LKNPSLGFFIKPAILFLVFNGVVSMASFLPGWDYPGVLITGNRELEG
jgi:hypothetical protein